MNLFQKKYIFIAIFILLAFSNISLRYKLFFIGDPREREQILSSTIWKLHKDGYNEKDIKNIEVYYNPLKGGCLPYDVRVVFKKDSSREYIYSWNDVDKNKRMIEHSGECASKF